MGFLEIASLTKSYAANQVVKGVDLDVARGEFITLLGPSGCGKTTVLRMVAGFETPTSGTIRMDGQDVTDLAPNQRKVGMVFQAYALFPNMTIADNIAFGLKIAKRPSSEIAPRVKQMLDMIKLPHVGDRYPFQLSGGQQQRVALARAVAVSPRMLLLDEPLSALDAKVRVSLRDEIRALQKQLGITTLFVTHDQEEALSMSDRIVVMSEGRIEQVGTPFEIYNQPRTGFVATFVGTLSTLRGRVLDPSAGTLDIGGQAIRAAEAFQGAQAGEERAVALRPEAMILTQAGTGAPEGVNALNGTVEEVSFLGSIVRLRLGVGGSRVLLDTFNDPRAKPPERGDAVTVSFAPGALHVLEEARAA